MATGYELDVCTCVEGPFLGSRKKGAPALCLRCGFLTKMQMAALNLQVRGPNTVDWEQRYRGQQRALKDAREQLDKVQDKMFAVRAVVGMMNNSTAPGDEWVTTLLAALGGEGQSDPAARG